jgi:hypothetical protein
MRYATSSQWTQRRARTSHKLALQLGACVCVAQRLLQPACRSPYDAAVDGHSGTNADDGDNR